MATATAADSSASLRVAMSVMGLLRMWADDPGALIKDEHNALAGLASLAQFA